MHGSLTRGSTSSWCTQSLDLLAVAYKGAPLSKEIFDLSDQRHNIVVLDLCLNKQHKHNPLPDYKKGQNGHSSLK